MVASLLKSFLVICSLSLLSVFVLSNAQSISLSVSEERPCPDSNVTFTCIVPGNSVAWTFPNQESLIITISDELEFNREEFGYWIEAVILNSTSVRSTLTGLAEEGLTMICEEGELRTVMESATIQLASRPSAPQNLRHLVLASTTPSVSVQWDPPTENGGKDDLMYFISVSPTAQLSSSEVSSTFVTVYPDLSVRYTISIVTTNCAGNSTASEYVFTVCPPAPPVSIGAAVGITVALCFVFFLGSGVLIGLLIAYCWNKSKQTQSKPSEKMSPVHVPLQEEVEMKQVQQ